MSLDTTGVDIFAGLPGLFCDLRDTDISRYDLSTPWRAGDWAHASDSRALIRIHRDAVERHVWEAIPKARTSRPKLTDAMNGRPMRGHRPAAAALFHNWAGRHEAEPVALPAVCLPTITCEECEGTGAIDHGTGTPRECEDCDGSGELWNRDPVEVARGYWLAARYVALFWAAGAAVYSPKRFPGWKVAPARFVQDDATGLAMPIQPTNAMAFERGMQWLGGRRP